jgi:hypothetical protein
MQSRSVVSAPMRLHHNLDVLIEGYEEAQKDLRGFPEPVRDHMPAAARNRLIQALDDPPAPCLLAPLDRLVADALESVSRSEIPDLPDRIVTATAAALRVPLISRDGKISARPGPGM